MKNNNRIHKSSSQLFSNYIPKNKRYTSKKHYIKSVFVPMDKYLDNANRYYRSNHPKNSESKIEISYGKTIVYLILTLLSVSLFVFLIYMIE